MELVVLEEVKDHLPAGFDPYTIYAIVVDHKEVGRLVLREGSDDQRYFDGHISYHIEEEYRGHHYAYQACLLLKDISDKTHLIITCDPQNQASLKTIQKLGCKYIETKSIPRHLKKFFARDEFEKCIFVYNLKEEQS